MLFLLYIFFHSCSFICSIYALSKSLLYELFINDKTLLIVFVTHLFMSFLSEPNFVKAIEYGDKVYFLFRETAVEYINCGKVC